MLYNPTNLSINSLYVIKNAMLVNEFALKENLNLETLIETLNLDLTNQDTLKLYKMNQESFFDIIFNKKKNVYISGIGGTGKSYQIKKIEIFF